MTLTYFTARSIWETWSFTWEKVKTMDILETVAASETWKLLDVDNSLSQ